MVARKPGHQGELEVSRNTIARGMPGVLGVTVVTAPRVIITTRDCGCTVRPAFPAPSFLRGEKILHSSGETRRENAEAWLARGAEQRSDVREFSRPAIARLRDAFQKRFFGGLHRVT